MGPSRVDNDDLSIKVLRRDFPFFEGMKITLLLRTAQLSINRLCREKVELDPKLVVNFRAVIIS